MNLTPAGGIQPPWALRLIGCKAHNNMNWGHRLERWIISRCLNPSNVIRYSNLVQTAPTDVLASNHYDDVIMTKIASQITSLRIVYSTIYTDVDQRKHQSSASLAFVWGIHRGPVNSPHKWPVTRKMFPFDDVIMEERPTSYMFSKFPWQNFIQMYFH